MMDGAVCPLSCLLPYKSGVGGRNQLHEKARKNTPHQASLVMLMHIAPCMWARQGPPFFFSFETCEPSADALRASAQGKKGSCSRILLGWPFCESQQQQQQQHPGVTCCSPLPATREFDRREGRRHQSPRALGARQPHMCRS